MEKEQDERTTEENDLRDYVSRKRTRPRAKPNRLLQTSSDKPHFGPMVEENSPGGHGVNFSLLLALHGGQVLSTMAEPEHHRYRWQLRVREDLGGHGDRQVIKPTLGGDSSDGRNL